MKNEIKKILREGMVMENRVKFSIQIPDDISELNHIFKRNGFNLYVVGGAVRDALLGKSPKDYDLATNASPDKVEEMMQQNGIRTIATGKAFGVINVFTDQGEYEVATFRTDKYDDDDIADLEGFKTYLKSLNNGSFQKFNEKLMK